MVQELSRSGTGHMLVVGVLISLSKRIVVAASVLEMAVVMLSVAGMVENVMVPGSELDSGSKMGSGLGDMVGSVREVVAFEEEVDFVGSGRTVDWDQVEYCRWKNS